MLSKRQATLAGCALAAVLLITAMPGSAQASSHKAFSIKVTQCVGPGHQDAPLSVVISNHAVDQSLGSVDVTIPADALQSPELNGEPVAGGVLELRGIGVPPGGSYSVEGLTADASSTPTTGTWGARGKQSNDFKGMGNDFALVGPLSDRQTVVGDDCTVEQTCSEDDGQDGQTACQVTKRHTVPSAYVNCLEAAAPGITDSCGSGGSTQTLSSGLSTSVAPYWVETDVTALPDGDNVDAGTLTLNYISQADARCTFYTEPSDLAARTEGPKNRGLVITYTISKELWAAAAKHNPTGPQSCFSAPYAFTAVMDLPPTFDYEGDTWFNGLLAPCATTSDPLQPCTTVATDGAGNHVVTDRVPYPVVSGDEPPASLLGGPDPMRY